MHVLADWAHGVHLGHFPLIAIIGFVTYGLFALAALTMIGRRWSKRFARRAFKLHRWIAYAGLLVATLHLLMGLSVYV